MRTIFEAEDMMNTRDWFRALRSERQSEKLDGGERTKEYKLYSREKETCRRMNMQRGALYTQYLTRKGLFR